MKRIGFLGYGKIGNAMAGHLIEDTGDQVAFVLDKCPVEVPENILYVQKAEEELFRTADLVVECATADALKEYAPMILKHCDLLVFSLTAFADRSFYETVEAVCWENNTRIYLPHGAILGLDGISDAKDLLEEVAIYTVKPPKSFGRSDEVRTVLFEGSTREACAAYPRNVNVHAAVALAGVGFDRTRSYIVSDPAYKENCHDIQVKGQGTSFRLEVKTLATGGVTGAYTPVSACGSLDRVLNGKGFMKFV